MRLTTYTGSWGGAPRGSRGGREPSGSYYGRRCGVEAESDVKIHSRSPCVTICRHSGIGASQTSTESCTQGPRFPDQHPAGKQLQGHTRDFSSAANAPALENESSIL